MQELKKKSLRICFFKLLEKIIHNDNLNVTVLIFNFLMLSAIYSLNAEKGFFFSVYSELKKTFILGTRK